MTFYHRRFPAYSPDPQFGLTALSYSVDKNSANFIEEFVALLDCLAGKPVSLIMTKLKTNEEQGCSYKVRALQKLKEIATSKDAQCSLVESPVSKLNAELYRFVLEVLLV